MDNLICEGVGMRHRQAEAEDFIPLLDPLSRTSSPECQDNDPGPYLHTCMQLNLTNSRMKVICGNAFQISLCARLTCSGNTLNFLTNSDVSKAHNTISHRFRIAPNILHVFLGIETGTVATNDQQEFVCVLIGCRF